MMRRLAAALTLLLLGAGNARALIIVDTLTDPLIAPAGNCTLRAAITAINSGAAQGGCPAGAAGETINFSVTGTLDLSASLPPITSSMTVSGPGAPQLTVDGGNSSSIFVINTNGVTFNVYYMTLTRGRGPRNGGGAIALGGAGAIPGTTVNASAVELVANGARFGGAVDVDGGATLVLTNSTVADNLSSNFGGAIDVFNGVLFAQNVTFSGNVAASSSGGGALYLGTNGTATLTSCTISGNLTASAAATGGGIKISNGSLTISNSIVAGNGPVIKPDISGSVTSAGYNLVRNRGSSSGWIASDLPSGTNPQLGPLGLYTPATTRTMSISITSPAFNAIPGCNGSPGTDQRGVPRPQGAACDIGAYEWIALPQEVSAFSSNALKVRKATNPALVVLDFEDQPGMTGYNAYQGNLPLPAAAPYTHGANPGNVCNVTTTAAGGRRTTPAAGLGTAGSRYYLVTSYTSSEGPSGFNSSGVEIPAAANTCAP